MDTKFELSLPGTRPRFNGVEVDAPARYYQRKVRGDIVSGLWIGGQRIYGVTIYDPADRAIGTIGPASSRASEAYDDLQRTLVFEAPLANPVAEAD